ncbi:hypothetical protein A9D60_15255 [Leisingera sp. JC1]|nr:hypothetical protein A9D60_15255 [Leisingera sp. JC1]
MLARILCGAALLAQPVHAGATAPKTHYACEIASSAYGNWLPRYLEVTFLEDSSSAEVFIPELLELGGKPEAARANARVKRKSSERLRVKWRSSVPTNLNFNTPVNYRLDLDSTELTGKMFATVPMSNHQRINGAVACKPAE